jgi:NADP-dependent 3-hydroxy acid dehydrogenase YdfG
MNKVIITGATGGVGGSLTRHFLKKKWEVIALIRDKNKLSKSYSDNLKYIEIDIKNFESVQKAFSKIDNINLLINNASVFISKEFKNCDETDINNIIDTNLKGTMYCTLEALKVMKKGRIINIGSVSGLHGIENQSIYSASKFGLMGFSDSLSQEITRKNILISNICPGGINTPLWNENNKYPGNVNNIIQPDDITKCVEFIYNLPDNMVLKNITTFPKCEWH